MTRTSTYIASLHAKVFLWCVLRASVCQQGLPLLGNVIVEPVIDDHLGPAGRMVFDVEIRPHSDADLRWFTTFLTPFAHHFSPEQLDNASRAFLRKNPIVFRMDRTFLSVSENRAWEILVSLASDSEIQRIGRIYPSPVWVEGEFIHIRSGSPQTLLALLKVPQSRYVRCSKYDSSVITVRLEDCLRARGLG